MARPTRARLARSPGLLLVHVVLVCAVACSGPAAASPSTSAVPPERVRPTGTPLAALATPRPSAVPSPSASSTAPTRAPAPRPTAVRPALTGQPAPSGQPAPTGQPAPSGQPAPTGRYTLDLFEAGDFVSQARADWCVPAAILAMINMIEPLPPGARRPPGQAELDRLARSLSTERLVGAGSEPEGWAGVLNRLGFGPYEVRAEPTRRTALATAARAIRLTRRPVGLLMWHGAHAWVMAGFEASADPAVADDFEVTHVRVVDPWHPRTSSIWGRAQPPGARLTAARLGEDFLRWRRPTVRYPEKDGRYVLVLPVEEAPAG